MSRSWRLWRWAFSLVMPLMVACTAKGKDFLYVLASTPGQRSEILWFPAQAPLSARVLVEGLDQTEFLHQHRDELWWWTEDSPVMGDLVGQREASFSEFGGAQVSDIVRQGDVLYWMTTSQIGSYDLRTHQKQVLVSHDLFSQGGNTATGSFTILAGGEFLFVGIQSGFRGLAIHEDRLYFGDGPKLDSIQIDGTDRCHLSTRDPARDPAGPVIQAPLFNFPFAFAGGIGPRGLAVYDDQLVWVKDKAFWKIDLKTGEESRLSEELPGSVNAMAVTEGAIYWIDGRKVWKWTRGTDEHEPLYELGDTRFHAIAVVTAAPEPTAMWNKDRVGVLAKDEGVYKLLFSEDLKLWALDYVRSSLFNQNGALRWLSPRRGSEGESLSWRPAMTLREAYFAAWRYDLGLPFDQDGDGLPDYWERRHFKDLSAPAEGDTNQDGITHLDEARLFLGPRETDADGDGLSNADEIAHVPPLNPTLADTDGDTLSDGDEVNVYQTDPHAEDTDSDGFTDGSEVRFGGDPTVSEIVPSGEALVAIYDDDLMVHFDFESSDNATVINRGELGGRGKIVGEESYVIRETEGGGESRALNLAPDPNDSERLSYVETNYRLDQLGFPADGGELTVALWLLTHGDHRGTFLSAAQFFGKEPAVSFQVWSEQQNGLSPLRLSLSGGSRFLSATTFDAVQPRRWTHVVWTEGSDGRSIYVDGNRLSTRSGDIGFLDGASTVWLGVQRGLSGVDFPFEGALDDVRIYRRVLPENVIKAFAR